MTPSPTNRALPGLMTAVCLMTGGAFASGDAKPQAAPDRVPNFRFMDVDGVEHELFQYRDAKAIVLFFQMNGCPIVRQSYPYFEEIKQQYAGRGVVFLYINSNKWDSAETVLAERADFKFTPPVLIDAHRALAHYLQIERSADTFVIDPAQDWSIVYHGMADDRFDYGLQRMSPSQFWLRDALDAILSAREPAHTETVAKGCLIDMDTYEGVLFDRHVRPILETELRAEFLGPVEDEDGARANSDRILAALLTGRDSGGNPVTLTDIQAESLVAWLFGNRASD